MRTSATGGTVSASRPLRRTLKPLPGGLLIAAGLALAGTAMAAPPQDPGTGGQLNQCWGQVASQLAQFATPDGTSGGGMGQHSRSTQAANQNGGFASDNNAFEITLNVDGGREGVGNVSNGPPHSTHPGDGGNGQHAINNGNLAAVLDPVDGQGAGQVLPCDLP